MKKTEKKKKQINPNTRCIVWGVADKIVAILPLLVLAIIRWEVYFSTKTTFSNIIGFGLLGAFMALILSKKTEVLKGSWGFIFFFIVVYTLRAIVNDIVLISGVACIGVIVSALWTTPKKQKWEKRRDKEENADITANTFVNMMNNFKSKNESDGGVSGRA